MRNIIKILILAIAFPLLAFSTTLTLSERDALLDLFGDRNIKPMAALHADPDLWESNMPSLQILAQNVLDSESIINKDDAPHIAIYLMLAGSNELTRMERLRLGAYSASRNELMQNGFTVEQYDEAKSTGWTEYLNAAFVDDPHSVWGNDPVSYMIGLVSSHHSDIEELLAWAPNSLRYVGRNDLRYPIENLMRRKTSSEAYAILSELETHLISTPHRDDARLDYVRAHVQLAFARVMREKSMAN